MHNGRNTGVTEDWAVLRVTGRGELRPDRNPPYDHPWAQAVQLAGVNPPRTF
jgi:hypothetical protein